MLTSSLNGNVQVYDSLQSQTLSKCIQVQLAQLYVHLAVRDRIKVHLVESCRQTNGSDCGVYVLANLAEIAANCDPKLAQFDPTRIRRHATDCFEKGALSRFPQVAKKRQGRKAADRVIYVKCL